MNFVINTPEKASKVFLTGFNTLCGGFELKREFSVIDVMVGGCLDASPFVPSGSTISNRVTLSNRPDAESYTTNVCSSCKDLLYYRAGWK